MYSIIDRWALGIRRSQQRIALSISRYLLNLRTDLPKAYNPKDTQKILILVPDAIGECLMATVFMNVVKAHRPDIEITVASGSTAETSLAGCGALDQFIAIDETARPKQRLKLLADEIEQKKINFVLL